MRPRLAFKTVLEERQLGVWTGGWAGTSCHVTDWLRSSSIRKDVVPLLLPLLHYRRCCAENRTETELPRGSLLENGGINVPVGILKPQQRSLDVMTGRSISWNRKLRTASFINKLEMEWLSTWSKPLERFFGKWMQKFFIEREGGSKTNYVISCSFGKDSLAQVILAHQHGEPVEYILYVEVMYDIERNISAEIPEHRDFIYNIAIPKLQ